MLLFGKTELYAQFTRIVPHEASIFLNDKLGELDTYEGHIITSFKRRRVYDKYLVGSKDDSNVVPVKIGNPFSFFGTYFAVEVDFSQVTFMRDAYFSTDI
jgi:hypothetical protein